MVAAARVIIPICMRSLCSGPPVRAFRVWDKLPQWVREETSSGDWAYPLYSKLAMGSSHSVFFLTAINLFQVGQVLTHRFNRSSTVSADGDRIAHMRAAFHTTAPVDDARLVLRPGQSVMPEAGHTRLYQGVLENKLEDDIS